MPEPAGTRGYDDLRRRAERGPLGRGLRPQVASADDLARMLGALDRDQDVERLLRLRRLMNLERQLSRYAHVAEDELHDAAAALAARAITRRAA